MYSERKKRTIYNEFLLRYQIKLKIRIAFLKKHKYDILLSKSNLNRNTLYIVFEPKIWCVDCFRIIGK